MGKRDTARQHAGLAARQLIEGAHGSALENVSVALALAPELDALWAQFAALIRYFNLRHPVPERVRELLERSLEHPAVDPGDLVRPVTSLALSRGPQSAFGEPLLLRLLEQALIRDAALEQLIVERRRTMLEHVMHDAPALAAATAIAHQCLNTEYVFDETHDERARLGKLHEALLSAAEPPAHWFAVYAMYRPLSEMRPPIESLARRHISEPLEEQQLRTSIPSLGESASGVSAAVRAQYEANPYPRWLRSARPLEEKKGPGRILVAGCGTGQQAITTAQRFPDASILAVDLSLSSLAYAKRKSQELRVRNIEYRQGDLLALDGSSERFDLIECSGVLHHLEDPLAGWRALAGLRKPGATMRIGLYSELGRRGVVRARELIAAEGFKPDAAGIRACRAAIRARTQDELLARVAQNEDFFSMSGCRDLLFHVQEQRLTLPQIAAMLRELGLRFLGFEFPDSGETMGRYGKSDALDLDAWHRFEQANPDTFARMYQFRAA